MEWIQTNWTTLLIGIVLILVVFKGFIIGKIFGISSMSSADLAKKLKEMPNEVLVIDVRTPQEFNGGHIKGARSMPMGSISEKLNVLSAKEKGKLIAVICASGSRSMMAAPTLKRAGIQKVYNISGGMMSWQRLGQPVVR